MHTYITCMKMKKQTNLANVQRSRVQLYLAISVCNLSSVALGITLSWSSPVISKLNGEVSTVDLPLGRLITDEEESWIGSLVTLGAASGPYIGAFLADSIGRKKTLIFAAGIPSFISFVILAFATNLYVYYFARYIGGLAIGAIYTALPSYVSEISEDVNRGATGCAMNIFITLGLIWSYSIGPFVSIRTFSLICAVVPLTFIILFSFFPESPYHYAAKNDLDKAHNALSKVRMKTIDEIKGEMKTIKDTVDGQMKDRKGICDLFKTYGSVKALIICMSLVAFQQFSGINVVLFYTQTIFEATGSSISSILSSFIIGLVQLIPSAITSLIADSLGRKVTLLFSALGQILSLFPLGLYFFLKEKGNNVEAVYWLPVTCLVIYIVTFRVGFGPLPWTIMAELFPQNIKTAACTITGSFCYILAFVITKYFQTVTYYIGMGGGFWIFTGFCISSFLFIYFYVPETKQKSFLEIQDILHGRHIGRSRC
ncbi:facilitated trehalose transporter Tret1-like [Agrilus planipennis]|uniref:Facilitated trehalose transporter Tret1-like n=1 Tax=Agrilus planipennis TaxID=224129 RepID=A0A1W4WNE8_AGRPL|nr:facilitated trehalose transporter Tret1-like [Agrilus planipennis]